MAQRIKPLNIIPGIPKNEIPHPAIIEWDRKRKERPSVPRHIPLYDYDPGNDPFYNPGRSPEIKRVPDENQRGIAIITSGDSDISNLYNTHKQ